MKLIKVGFALLWICAAVTASAAQDTREARVALVIGNGAYVSVGNLDNPSRDAAAVAQALREAGFQTVQVENDLGHDAMLRALRRFEEAADKADWALVYYAGHGIEAGGINYLIPVDARLRSDRDVDEEAISLAQVQKRLEGAHKLRLVILDACRDNPFVAKMRRTQVSSRSVGRGLAVPELPQSGSLVAYSAAAGQVALDGETSAGNSPYAAALIKNLAVPDVEVNLFFRKVRAEVLRATGNKQEPATYESLPEDRFVLRLPPSPALPSSLPSETTLPQIASPPAVIPTQPQAVSHPDGNNNSKISTLDQKQYYNLDAKRTDANIEKKLETNSKLPQSKDKITPTTKRIEKVAPSRTRVDRRQGVAQRADKSEVVSPHLIKRHDIKPTRARGSCPTFEGRPIC